MSSAERPPAPAPGSIDVVYTWVDGAAPGYQQLLARHARTRFDADPSRTRDNLDLIRYSIRSLERFAPWVGRIFILTCRPQVPAWLNRAEPRVQVIHHDEIMDGADLPTFNSLAIVSHLHKIPGLSSRFLYVEDDMLFLSPVTPADFISPHNRQYVFANPRHWAPQFRSAAERRGQKPWNLALSRSNDLLDAQFGHERRRQVNHVPLLIEKQTWQEMLDIFAEAVRQTRASRFRAEGNVALEFIYPHFLRARGLAEFASPERQRESSGYLPLENFWPLTAWKLRAINRRRTKWVTINDNFGAVANPIAEYMVRRCLEHWLPEPSRFEKRD